MNWQKAAQKSVRYKKINFEYYSIIRLRANFPGWWNIKIKIKTKEKNLIKWIVFQNNLKKAITSIENAKLNKINEQTISWEKLKINCTETNRWWVSILI